MTWNELLKPMDVSAEITFEYENDTYQIDRAEWFYVFDQLTQRKDSDATYDAIVSYAERGNIIVTGCKYTETGHDHTQYLSFRSTLFKEPHNQRNEKEKCKEALLNALSATVDVDI